MWGMRDRDVERQRKNSRMTFRSQPLDILGSTVDVPFYVI